MIIECKACEKWHRLSPTAMAVVIHSYGLGDLQRVGKNGVLTLVCIREAFTPDNVVEFRRRYQKNDIKVDDKEYGKVRIASD